MSKGERDRQVKSKVFEAKVRVKMEVRHKDERG